MNRRDNGKLMARIKKIGGKAAIEEWTAQEDAKHNGEYYVHDLSGANLTGADLKGAVLTSFHLQYATLARCNFSGAKLDGADLEGANLSEANLTEADLSRANLYLTKLERARISGCNLSNALLDSAVDLDMSLGLPERIDARNLEYLLAVYRYAMTHPANSK